MANVIFERNVGKADGIIRIVLAILILYFIDSWAGTVQTILAVFVAILLFTGLSRFCLFYKLFNYSSKKKDK